MKDKNIEEIVEEFSWQHEDYQTNIHENGWLRRKLEAYGEACRREERERIKNNLVHLKGCGSFNRIKRSEAIQALTKDK